MDHLTPSHLQMQRNINKVIMFSPSNHGSGSSAINKVNDCARLRVSKRWSIKERVCIRMSMDSARKRDGDPENFSIRNCGRFGKNEGINYSRVPSGEEQHEEDWRSFRARLVHANSSNQQRARNFNSAEWAHEIKSIEEGCVLVATEELKQHPLLSEAVVLVLQWPLSSSSCKGIVLNKMFPYDTSSMDIVDPMLRNLNLPVFMGGPAVGGPGFGSRFHVLTRQKGVAGFECILPGLHVGNMGVTVQSAMRSDVAMRLYLGEIELEKRHLRAQVEAFGWWKIVACSREALFSTIFSTTHMWCHINHLLTS
ncbi:uncharacterized protein LOC131859664 [Cryptomeria japonica]|uniref:uncharacterized protein LOC131859664 n=1 Tax=Cryptomeria japonica TaxID=3369 RepID=UPI0027DA5EE2|nr:uncharacterized protein LOC131859664 [Cryptomeria japonica]